jgi:hypothetical protein
LLAKQFPARSHVAKHIFNLSPRCASKLQPGVCLHFLHGSEITFTDSTVPGVTSRAEQNNFSIHKFPRHSPFPTAAMSFFSGEEKLRFPLLGEKDKPCVLQIFGHEHGVKKV